MRKSVRRYLLAGGFLALLVNLAINAAAGVAIYGGLTEVPLAGDHGLAGDTIVGAFLIAFFTLVIVAPATRREVRAGRVIGGRRRAMPGWVARRPFSTAILGGIVSAAVIGGGAVAIVAALGIAPMSVPAFLAFKIAFAGAWGSLAAVLVGALAIADEPEPPDDDRWCRDGSVPSVAYPLDYVDKGGLAVTSKVHGCSGTPTWQLVARGAPDPAAVRAALGALLVRYPSLTTRVQSLDAIPEYAKRFRYAGAPVDLDAVFQVVDLRGRPGELEPLIRDVWNRHLDQFPRAAVQPHDGAHRHRRSPAVPPAPRHRRWPRVHRAPRRLRAVHRRARGGTRTLARGGSRRSAGAARLEPLRALHTGAHLVRDRRLRLR